MPNEYTALVTSSHNKRPRFMAVVELLTSAVSSVRTVMATMPDVFDVDTAVGKQLDAVGRWAGISRVQRVPVDLNFFAFDTSGRGWDQAVWKGAYLASETTTVLDDDTYRVLIKAKIGGNYWKGSSSEYSEVGGTSFQDLGVEVYAVDNMDMTMDLYIVGNPSPVLLSMIKRGIAPPKIAGVQIRGYILASSPGAPFTTIPEAAAAGISFGSYT